MAINNMFQNTLGPNSVTKFTLFRGVTDYSNLAQFDLYETGYSFLVCLQIPKFLSELTKHNATNNNSYANLINNYRHIIEWEFRGAQGLEDISTDTSPISNGITDLNVITKVNEQGGSQFTMNYFERSGSIINKTNELFLRGIKDPKTQVKRYNGLLRAPYNTARQDFNPNSMSAVGGTSDGSTGSNIKFNYLQEASYQYEIFHFLLIITDNTCLNVEKAYLLACCQPASANTSIYNVTRGEIQFQEIAVQFNGIPLPGRIVNRKATEFLKYINDHTCFDEMSYGYSVLDESLYNIDKNSNYVSDVEKANSNGDELRSHVEDDIMTSGYDPVGFLTTNTPYSLTENDNVGFQAATYDGGPNNNKTDTVSFGNVNQSSVAENISNLYTGGTPYASVTGDTSEGGTTGFQG